MNKDRTVTISFRLNLALEMDKQIYKFFNQLCQDNEMREYFGDKSKFIKTAVYNAIEAVQKLLQSHGQTQLQILLKKSASRGKWWKSV